MSKDTPSAVIAVGSGRYSDPWHPFAEVAAQVAEILRADGWSVVLDDDVDAAMTRLGAADLLVVIAGNPWDSDDPHFGAPPSSIAGLDAALARGIGVLGMHSAAASLRDYPAWASALGGIWIPGASLHPPFEESASVCILPGHPLASGLSDFALADERYSYLQPVGERSVLLDHEHNGMRHPLMWTREYGASRVAYDGLGHDTRSFASPQHRELVRRLARWAGRR